MAIKKIEIRPKGTNNYRDVLYPKTSADQVEMSDGITVENKINNIKIPVESVNNKTGKIILGAEDIKTNSGETVELELKNVKTDLKNNMHTNKYDKNQNGKVDIAEVAESVDWGNVKNKPDLNKIGKVTSVNGQTGAVTLSSSGIKYKYSSYDSIYDVIEGVKKDIKNIDLNAEKVSLSSTNFRSQNVKAALEELFTFADNGKKNWVDVVGSPLSAGDSFSTLKSKTQTLKNTFASNLSSKKVSASGTESLNSLINKIKNIDTGLKYATGTYIAPKKGTSEQITGISFTPKIVYISGEGKSSGGRTYPFFYTFISKDYLGKKHDEEWGVRSFYSGSPSEPIMEDGGIYWVNNGGFHVTTSSTYIEGSTMTWVAIGR